MKAGVLRGSQGRLEATTKLQKTSSYEEGMVGLAVNTHASDNVPDSWCKKPSQLESRSRKLRHSGQRVSGFPRMRRAEMGRRSSLWLT